MFLRHGLWIMLGALLLGSCTAQESSVLHDALPLMEDKFAGEILDIDIQAGQNNVPNVCVIKADGQLNCYSSGRQNAFYSSLRNLGKLKDVQNRCAVNQYGKFACALRAGDSTLFGPRQDEVVGRIDFTNDQDLCAVISGTPDRVKCYSAANPTGKVVLEADKSSSRKPDGTPQVPLAKVKQFAQTMINGTGAWTACAVYASGHYQCSGQKVVADSQHYVGIALNQDLRCLLTDTGLISCSHVATNAPAVLPDVRTTGVVELAGRDKIMCARYADGDLSCWSGAIVYNKDRFRSVEKAVKIQANRFGICAVFSDDFTRCFDPQNGTLVAYEDLKSEFLVASSGQACGFTSDGTVSCWGNAAAYQVPPSLPMSTGKELAVGESNICYLSRGQASCLDRKSQPTLPVPAAVKATYLRQIVASAQHACSLDSQGRPSCWGSDALGQTAVPVGIVGAKRIFTGRTLACLIDSSSNLQCWGDSQLSKLPDTVKIARDVAIGDQHVCILNQDDQVQCWGDPTDGRTIPPYSVNGYRNLYAGAAHSCAIDKSDFVTCWGKNDFSQSLIPKAFITAKAMALGDGFSCATNSRGHVGCWGNPQGSDVAGRFELTDGRVRQEYDDVLVRNIPFKTNLKTCDSATGICQFPEEPVLSFSGFDIRSPALESYALWVEFTTTCPLDRVHLVLNGRLFPDFIAQPDGRKVARFYDLKDRSQEFETNLQGSLIGPALLQVRYGTSRSALTTRLGENCDYQIDRITLVPSENTTTLWGEKASDLITDLSDGLDALLDFRIYEGISLLSYQTNAKALHEWVRGKYLAQVKLLMDQAKVVVPGITDQTGADAPMIALRDVLTIPVTLKLAAPGGESEDFASFQIKRPADMPAWYKTFYARLSSQDRASLTSLISNYGSSTSVLTATYDATRSDNTLRLLANRIGRGKLDTALRSSNYLVKVAGYVERLLNTEFENIISYEAPMRNEDATLTTASAQIEQLK